MRTLADGDYYAKYADVQHILMNAGLGTEGDTLWNENAIEKALKISQARLHLRIGVTESLTSISSVVFVEILKGIQIHMIQQFILASRSMKENSLSTTDILNTFWTLSPNLTNDQKAELREIKRKYHGLAIKNYDIRSGVEI